MHKNDRNFTAQKEQNIQPERSIFAVKKHQLSRQLRAHLYGKFLIFNPERFYPERYIVLGKIFLQIFLGWKFGKSFIFLGRKFGKSFWVEIIENLSGQLTNIYICAHILLFFHLSGPIFLASQPVVHLSTKHANGTFTVFGLRIRYFIHLSRSIYIARKMSGKFDSQRDLRPGKMKFPESYLLGRHGSPESYLSGGGGKKIHSTIRRKCYFITGRPSRGQPLIIWGGQWKLKKITCT